MRRVPCWPAVLLSLVSLSGSFAAEFATKYPRRYPFIVGRSAASSRAAEILYIPLGSTLNCKATQKTETLLGLTGVWNYCKNLNGFVFGPLLADTRDATALKGLRLYHSHQDDHHQHGEEYLTLSDDEVVTRGWSEWVGSPGHIPRKNYEWRGTYRIANRKIEITYAGKDDSHGLVWLPKLKVFAYDSDIRHHSKTIDNHETMPDWNYRKDQCALVGIGHRLNFFCPR